MYIERKSIFQTNNLQYVQYVIVKGRYKNGTDLLYHRAKYGGDRGSRAGCRRKCLMFFVRFFVTLWNYEVCDINYGTVA